MSKHVHAPTHTCINASRYTNRHTHTHTCINPHIHANEQHIRTHMHRFTHIAFSPPPHSFFLSNYSTNEKCKALQNSRDPFSGEPENVFFISTDVSSKNETVKFFYFFSCSANASPSTLARPVARSATLAGSSTGKYKISPCHAMPCHDNHVFDYYISD